MNEIKCLFFAEFHPTAGPKITYQVPEDYISKKFFDANKSYFITKSDLHSRIITVNSLGEKIIGCPVCIANKKYDRNELIFNLCFVFDSETRTAKYEPTVRKLAKYLKQLELEGAFLSNEEKKARIPQFLNDVLTNLNKTGSCSLFMDESCTIHLKVSPFIEDPKPIQDHDVPVFVQVKPRRKRSHWDLTTQQVLQYIDGFNHVAKIAAEADIEINLVKACLQNLLHFDVISIISVFQYSNMYQTTDLIRLLAEDDRLQEECLQYVACKGILFCNFKDTICSILMKELVKTLSPTMWKGTSYYGQTAWMVQAKPRRQHFRLVQLERCCRGLIKVCLKGPSCPCFRDVLMLYSSLTPGLTVKDLCLRYNPHSMNIDERKLIQFGLKRKIIRRLHGYPIKLPSEEKLTTKAQPISKFLNGMHSLDEISCKSGLNYKDLDEIVEGDPSIVMCWK